MLIKWVDEMPENRVVVGEMVIISGSMKNQKNGSGPWGIRGCSKMTYAFFFFFLCV
jgi:hypothetical protein